MTIKELKKLKESENKVEFKEAKGGNFAFNGGSRINPKERRRSILGYVTAFANEGGGYLVFGMTDKYPHEVVGSSQAQGSIGKLEQDIYAETRIRIEAFELFENDKRLLIISIPSRPFGKVYKFEDVALMRVGEELLPMSDEQYLKIIQEQEPDFSERICEGLTIDHLDETAIDKMKEAYARKQGNPQFLTLSNEQALRDLNLKTGNKLTNATLILLGKAEAILKFLPQSQLIFEYRNSSAKIIFDNRTVFSEAYFTLIDKIWNTINLRNDSVPVQEGPYVFNIPYFNHEVIREALNNAVAHRDYRRTSEIVIKQYPNELVITNPGGFPPGVTIDNLLTVNSTPRNRLLADVLAKTGIVERAGQGVDKMFYQCLSEAKLAPDYSLSDDFQVELHLSAIVEDKAFALFIHHIQKERETYSKLSVQEIIALNNIRKNQTKNTIHVNVLAKLEKDGLIEKIGKTNKQKIVLSKEYYSFTDNKGTYSKEKPIDEFQISVLVVKYFQEFETAKMSDFVKIFDKLLTREQVKYAIYNLTENGIIIKSGEGRNTEYRFNMNFKDAQKMLERIVELGVEEMKKRGEMKD
jgi:ATP-dependent DNA helicase RecG